MNADYDHFHDRVIQMEEYISNLQDSHIQQLLLQVLAWRLGDNADLPSKLLKSSGLNQASVYRLIETFCPPLDETVNNSQSSISTIEAVITPSLSKALRTKIATIVFSLKDKCVSFCSSHAPSLSRVVYHDWKIETQIATESLGRFTRPVALITLRVQPTASAKLLLPPLNSVRIELAKEMIDALSAGFDKLQNQLVRIIQ